MVELESKEDIVGKQIKAVSVQQSNLEDEKFRINEEMLKIKKEMNALNGKYLALKQELSTFSHRITQCRHLDKQLGIDYKKELKKSWIEAKQY